VQSLKAPIAELVRYKREIDSQEEEVRDLTSSMTDIGGSRTVEEMQESLKQLNEEAKSVKNRIKALETDRENRRQNITALERQVNDARKRLNELALQLVEARTLNERIEEYQEVRNRQNTVIDETDRHIEHLVPDIMAAEAKLKEIVRECSEREKKQQRDATRLAQSDMNLKSIQLRIQNYISEGGLTRLNRCREQVQRLQAEVEKLSNDLTKNGDEISKLEKRQIDAGTTQRTITENIRYRKNELELKEIEKEIEGLEDQHAEVHRDRFTKDADLLANKHMRLSSEVCILYPLSLH
jgi:DNA repair protein RAD50